MLRKAVKKQIIYRAFKKTKWTEPLYAIEELKTALKTALSQYKKGKMNAEQHRQKVGSTHRWTTPVLGCLILWSPWFRVFYLVEPRKNDIPK
jgi:hypothetical protein